MNATTQTQNSEEAAIFKAIMSEYDIHIGFDFSGSMAAPHKDGASRISVAKELAMQMTAAALEIDTDGIDLVKFNNGKAEHVKATDMTSVDKMFSEAPNGGTPLLQGLQTLLKNAGASPKKDLILILTDGEPDGGTKPAIAKTIIEQANSQEADDDCTICFIQLGNDAGATAFLKSLDDDLKGAKFDIVDAITAEDVYKAPSLAHVLKAAITG